MLNQSTGDPDLDLEIEYKTLTGTLTEDEKAWISTYNTICRAVEGLEEAIGREYGVLPDTKGRRTI